ncbi:MAG: hypothetical protein ACSLFI_01365 [Solirubrobacterales bacterium]
MYYPPISRAEDLIDTVSRAAWFLTYSDFERITILISDPSLEDVVWRVAPDMDPLIAERFEALRAILRLVPDDSPELADVIDQTDVILRWSTAGHRSESPDLRRRLEDKRTIDVDPRRTRHEGGNYIELGFRSSDNPEYSDSRQRQKFVDLSARLGTFDRAVILATGPSASDYGAFDYGDSLRVVCNTAVLDHELMKVVNPQIVVFLDPVFHFGPSSYAAQFRAKVREAAEEFDFEIVIASKYLPVLAAALPELLDRTIAIPFKPGRYFNFDLKEDFEVRATANVLTFMMIPLAGTFAKTIGMLGCDGRPMNESGHFWKHHPSTQLGSELDALRRVHPGFFDIEYNDYYLEHCRTLEAEIEAGERAGLDFVSLAPSHIPALAERTGGTAAFTDPASHRAQAQR